MSIDLGAGDGRLAYEYARRCPERLFVGVDPNDAALVHYSRKALRKPAKGGIDNVLYVCASIEALPDELCGVADAVSVVLPWGSLLRAVALPDTDLLGNVRRLCRPGAALEVILGYDCARERLEAERLGLPELTQAHNDGPLASGYRAAGFRLACAGRMSAAELRALPSTWAKRLAFGRERAVWRLRAEALASPGL